MIIILMSVHSHVDALPTKFLSDLSSVSDPCTPQNGLDSFIVDMKFFIHLFRFSTTFTLGAGKDEAVMSIPGLETL